MKYSDLLTTLRGANKQTYTVTLPDGTRALLLLHGGRVLGLSSPGSDENFYWTHPALQSAESAVTFYSSLLSQKSAN